MTSTRQLDQVIRRVPKKTSLANGEVFVAIDPDTCRVAGTRFRLPFGKSPRCYVVSNTTVSRNVAEGSSRVVPVEEFATKREIGVIVDYQVECPVGKEEEVACALSREQTPDEALLNILDLAVEDYAKGREAEIHSDYDALKGEFTDAVRHYLESNTGLKAKIRLHLKYEDALSVYRISERVIPIRVKENTEEHSLVVNAELAVDRNRFVEAIIAYPDLHLIEEELVRFLQEHFSRSVPFHAFHDGMTDPKVLSDLETAINGFLASQGRILGQWSVEPRVKGGQASDFLPLSIEISRTPYEANETVTISNELQMLLVDAGKLKASGIKELKDWAKERLERVIEEEVFEMRYLDFLLRFEPVEKKIRERMRDEAKKIGYRIKHLISRPDMKEEAYLKPSPYSFVYNGLPTGAADITVNLEVVTTFSIPELGDVEKWLNKNVDLKSVIETSIRSQLEQVLHQQSPETVYMRFATSDAPGVPSLEAKLVKAVRQHLESDYRADVIRPPVIKPMDTEIGKFVGGLMDDTRDFDVPIRPRGGSEEFHFYGKFTITSVHQNGWGRIRKQDFTVEDVKAFYVDTLKTILESLPGDEMLAYTTPHHQRELESVANRKPEEAVIERYGVHIAINNLRRDLSSYEKLQAEVRNDHRIAALDDASYLLEQARENRESDKDIAALQRAARTDQARLFHEQQLQSIGDGEEDEAQERLEMLDEGYEQRIRPRETGGEDPVGDILARLEKDSRNRNPLAAPSVKAALEFEAENTRSPEGGGADPQEEKDERNP